MPEKPIVININVLPEGHLKKIEQIINAGVLEVRGDMAEIHFDKDGNIRKIKAPKVSIYPNEK